MYSFSISRSMTSIILWQFHGCQAAHNDIRWVNLKLDRWDAMSSWHKDNRSSMSVGSQKNWFSRREDHPNIFELKRSFRRYRFSQNKFKRWRYLFCVRCLAGEYLFGKVFLEYSWALNKTVQKLYTVCYKCDAVSSVQNNDWANLQLWEAWQSLRHFKNSPESDYRQCPGCHGCKAKILDTYFPPLLLKLQDRRY